MVSTHSRPKAAGSWIRALQDDPMVSTHSRPKAAGSVPFRACRFGKFQHTAARRRLEIVCDDLQCLKLFQHTAARRRLVAGI